MLIHKDMVEVENKLQDIFYINLHDKVNRMYAFRNLTFFDKSTRIDVLQGQLNF
jgi:hypothetical protein